MEIDMLRLFKDIVNTHGIDFHIYAEPYADAEPFDGGLRGRLYEGFNYGDIYERFNTDCAERTLYKAADQFEVRYTVFKTPGENGGLAVVGPYLLDPCDAVTTDIIERNNLPLFHTAELKNYYYGVPLVADKSTLDAQIYTLAGYLFGGSDQFSVAHLSTLSNQETRKDYRIDPQNSLSMAAIEERYNWEDELLLTVEQGNQKKAMLTLQASKKYRLQTRHADKLREQKNYAIVSNTLFRKAVQKAEVHPAHIDSVSAAFAKRIEAATDADELTLVCDEMIRKYCMLVENHSLRGYSPNIQRIINHIDFNLTEPLTLNYLASLFALNSSYLSDHFRKETGKTVTDYIIDKRIQSAVFLLNTTDLPVAVIGGKVGFTDENYFSRVFKKVQHKTPREYRKSFR